MVLWIPTQPVSDFREYFARAVALKESGSFNPSPETRDAPYPPGYPLVLALAMILLPGTSPLLAAKLANCALGAGTIWIGARVAREIGGDRAGLAAALLFGFYPRQLLMPAILASENLFTPLLLLFVLVAIRAARAPTAASALTAGVLAGALALTRTVAYPFAVVWAAGAIAARRRPLRIAVEVVLLLLVQHAVMVPWALRNLRDLGAFTFLTSTGGISLFVGNNPNANGDWYPWHSDLERLRPNVFAGTPMEVDAAARAEAIEWITANPGRAARLYAERARLILVQDHLAADWAIYAESVAPPEPGISVVTGPHPLKPHRRIATRVLRAAGLSIALLACAGAVLLFRAAFRERNAPRAAGPTVLVVCAAYLLLVPASVAANGRYRWPLEDLCVPFAAAALARMNRVRAPARR